ncbi:hypothetical protein F53441_793 [Fusarium austroafricanum]|uniref:Uncharacterized protein n=1 Tax=Fusarium austroafricanum TaxID=2364996 RepID=A0A8H4NZR2_9HYPO|nr:hypothetical protein F53441_793 [Fusarium austroafricanum]
MHNFEAHHVLFSLQNRDPHDGKQSGLVKILEKYFAAPFAPDDIKRMVKWFIKDESSLHGLSASDLDLGTSFQYATRQMRPRPPIDHLAEMLKWDAGKSWWDVKQDCLASMIGMLCDKGAVIDLHQDRFKLAGDPVSLAKFQKQHRPKRPDNAVEIAMRPSCPSSFLENFLRYRPEAEGALTDRSKFWRRFDPDRPRGMHRAVSNMEWIIFEIHRQFFEQFCDPLETPDPDKEVWDYPNDLGTMYKVKVDLLSNDDCTDETERETLKNLATAVQEIHDTLKPLVGTLNRDSDRLVEIEAQCWFKLSRAVSYLASDSYREECKQLAERFDARRHQFIISYRWDPRVEWMHMKLLKEFPRFSSPDGERLCDDAFEIWQKLIFERGDERQWWEIAEQDKWFVPMNEVTDAFRASDSGRPGKWHWVVKKIPKRTITKGAGC